MTTLGFVGSWLTGKNTSTTPARAISPEVATAGPVVVPAVAELSADPIHPSSSGRMTRRHLRREHISVCEVQGRKSLRLSCEEGELWITTPQGEDIIVRAGEVCPRLGPGTVIVQALRDSIYLWAIA